MWKFYFHKNNTLYSSYVHPIDYLICVLNIPDDLRFFFHNTQGVDADDDFKIQKRIQGILMNENSFVTISIVGNAIQGPQKAMIFNIWKYIEIQTMQINSQIF